MKKKSLLLIIIMLCFFCRMSNAQAVEDRTPQQAYAELLQSEQNIRNEMTSLSSMLPTLKGSKAKKAAKRLDELAAMKEAVERTKSYYPQSVREVQPAPRVEESAREQVRQMVDEKVIAKGGSLDVLDEEDEETETEQREPEGYWSIALDISTSSDINKYRSYGDVEVENMGGRYVFFLGRYRDKSEAEAECKRIVKKGKFRDAFVIKRTVL